MVTFDRKKADIERLVEATRGRIRQLEMARRTTEPDSHPQQAELRLYLQQAEARLDDVQRDFAREAEDGEDLVIKWALGALREAKQLLAQATVIQEEIQLRANWGDEP